MQILTRKRSVMCKFWTTIRSRARLAHLIRTLQTTRSRHVLRTLATVNHKWPRITPSVMVLVPLVTHLTTLTWDMWWSKPSISMMKRVLPWLLTRLRILVSSLSGRMSLRKLRISSMIWPNAHQPTLLRRLTSSVLSIESVRCLFLQGVCERLSKSHLIDFPW